MIRVNPAAGPDYYLRSENELGRVGAWGGEGARELGLQGIDADAFRKLMLNRTPGGDKLTQRDHPDRRTGIDVTFCEPKSASIAEQVLGDDRIAEARRASVDRVMTQLVEPLAATREKKWFGLGHLTVTTGNLAWKAFEHRLARPENGEPDPAGHIHAVAINATRHKGRWYALDMEPIKAAAPLLQAAWHNEYARGLKGLGYGIRPTKDAFEIAGIPDAAILKFSRRTATIEKELAGREQGLADRLAGFRPGDDAGERGRLERKLARLRSPKGKAALGAMIREKKAPAYEAAALADAWRSRLTAREARALEQVREEAMIAHEGPGPGMVRLYRLEPAGEDQRPDWIRQNQIQSGHAEAEGRWFVADPAMLEWYREDAIGPSRVVFVDVPAPQVERYRVCNVTERIKGRTPASFSKDPHNEFFLPRALAEERRPQAVEPPDRSAEHLWQTLDALMERESRVTETHLLTETLKRGIGEVTLPGLKAALAETELLRVDVRGEAMLQTFENRQKESELLRVARAGGIVWLTGKPERAAVAEAARRAEPDAEWVVGAGAMPFGELHRRATAAEASGRRLVLQGLPPKHAPAGHPLSLLRQVAGMEPVDNTPAKGRKVAALPALAWGVPVRRAAERLRRFAHWERHREEATRHVEHERLAPRERGLGR